MAGRPVVLGRRWHDEQERAARPWPALLIGWRRRVVLVRGRQRRWAPAPAAAAAAPLRFVQATTQHFSPLFACVSRCAALCVVCVGGGHGIDGTTTTTVATAMKRIGRGEHRIRDRSAFVVVCVYRHRRIPLATQNGSSGKGGRNSGACRHCPPQERLRS